MDEDGAFNAMLCRINEYREFADPLFFQWQAAMAEGQPDTELLKLTWLAERARIKATHRTPPATQIALD